MPTFTPIKQVKASDEVYNQLKEAILTEQYKAGDKLPSERELIEMFQVSRTVVREAIKVLEANSFVEIKQGSTGGAFVRHITFERLSNACFDLFMSGKMSLPEIAQARILIEPAAAKLAVRNCTDADLEKIKQIVESEHILSGENDDMVYNRSHLHYLIAELTGNRFLEAIIKSLAILVREVTKDLQPSFHPDKVHPAGMHDELLRAFLDRNDEAVFKAMHDHLHEFRDRLIAAEENFRTHYSK